MSQLTEADKAFICQHAASMCLKDLATRLGRKPSCVWMWAARHGVEFKIGTRGRRRVRKVTLPPERKSPDSERVKRMMDLAERARA